ncbi:MAG: hypothetical protein ACYCSS_06260 [Sulfuriferula sp.]
MTILAENDDDEILRRYLDGELAQAERDNFLANLNALEQRELRAMENALEALSRLPSISVPVCLAPNIMAAIAPKKPALLSRLKGWLALHPLLGWEVGSMVVAASVLFLLLMPNRPSLSVPAGQRSFIEAAATGSVRDTRVGFSLYAPGAKTVSLISDFNGWSSERSVQLHPQGHNTWVVAVKLPPGSYQYAFLINGNKVVTDPTAQHVNDDFGHKNAIITVI